MGVHAMVKHMIAQMKKDDTTNPRAIAKWARRAMDIAQKAENINNVACQERLKDVVEEAAAGLRGPGGNQIIAPKEYWGRKKTISNADRMLDELEPPPIDHTEDMRRAMTKDDEAWGSILKELGDADDELLKEVSELPLVNLEQPPSQGPDQEENQRAPDESSASLSPMNDDTQSFESSGSSSSTVGEERAHGNFKERLEKYKDGKREPSIRIEISDMETRDGESTVYEIPLQHTFCALADTLTSFKPDTFLPDFWSKEKDPARNCVTISGVWWEWQDPSRKVTEAILKEGHLRIETVHKESEYIVVLVKKGEDEDGIPIEVPRKNRPRAFEYFQQRFPDYTVSQVRRLEGTDASKEVFDYRLFPHKTNSLYVELKAQHVADETEDISTNTAAKGKGKARCGRA